MFKTIILNITRKFIWASNIQSRNIFFKQYFLEMSFQTRVLNSWSLAVDVLIRKGRNI